LARAALGAVAELIGWTVEEVVAQAARRIGREILDQKKKVDEVEEALARTEANLPGAIARAQGENLLPEDSTGRVIRYEAHLNRQLKTAYQLLAQVQAARARDGSTSDAGLPRPGTCGVEPAAVSTDRTRPAEAPPPEAVAAPAAPVDAKVITTDRSQTEATPPPIAEVPEDQIPTEPAGHRPEEVAIPAPTPDPTAVFADRTRDGGMDERARRMSGRKRR
jgi:hypothetical protein